MFVAFLIDCVFSGVYTKDNPTYIEDTLGIVSMWAIMTFSLGLNGDCFILLKEKEIYLREVQSNQYSVFAYYMSKIINSLWLQLLLPLVFILATYYVAGLPHSATLFW